MFRDVTLSHQVSHPPRYVEDAHPTDLEGEGPSVSIALCHRELGVGYFVCRTQSVGDDRVTDGLLRRLLSN